jgi:hypothetical protein
MPPASRNGNVDSTSEEEEVVPTTLPGAVDLYWLPLGAGGHFVRMNGRIYEALVAWRAKRPRRDLYHSALIVTVPVGSHHDPAVFSLFGRRQKARADPENREQAQCRQRRDRERERGGQGDVQPNRRTPSRTRIALNPSLHVIFFPSA